MDVPRIPWWAPIPPEDRKRTGRSAPQSDPEAEDEIGALIDAHNRLVAMLTETFRYRHYVGRRTTPIPGAVYRESRGRRGQVMVRPRGLGVPYGDGG